MGMKRIAGIFVTTDNPRFLEKQIDAPAEVFDLEQSDAKFLLSAYRARQMAYSTAPFDPTGERLRFFSGGFTIWSGLPGAGKTTLLRQLACHLMKVEDVGTLNGPGVFVCSMEESPQEVLIRHAQVACATEDLSENALQWCVDLWSQRLKLWNYRPVESDARHMKILAAIRVLAREQGVRHAVIDSLMCLDVASNDYEAQRLFAGELARTAQAAGVHIHLVAHPRKPYQGNQDMDINDVAGSADLGRKADNVLFVKRAPQEAGATFGHCTPMVISIKKQRYGTGFIGEVGGWFHRGFRQFVMTQFQDSPMRYLPVDAFRDLGLHKQGSGQ
jgi:twinkle protein